ncbi:MAG: hypothetical protein MJ069_09100 [Salinivirgaceae bacterium]|nr:hypothetical protein [Salinivirgaceae bacterium]
MLRFAKICVWAVLLLVVLTNVSCHNEIDDVVPLVEVRVRINTLSANYIDLQNDYGRAIIPNEGFGSNGILVFRVAENDYRAYDCTCTACVSAGCAVKCDEGNIAGAVCDSCGSKFELIECGMPTSGKAKYALKSYRTSFYDNYLKIRN